MADRTRSANGSPRPVRLPTGRWELRFELPARPDGRRIRKRVTADTPEDCRRRARAAQAEHERTGVATDGSATVGQLVEHHLDEVTRRGELRDTTIKAYRSHAANYVVPYLGKRRARDLLPMDVNEWLDELGDAGRSVKTRQLALTALKRALRWGELNGLVARNVATVVAAPRGGSKRPEALEPRRLSALFDACDDWDMAGLVYLMGGAGLRISEAFGLQWRDLHLPADPTEPAYVKVCRQLNGDGNTAYPTEMTKTEAGRRTVDLMSRVREALVEHRLRVDAWHLECGRGPAAGDDLVFTRPDGRYASKQSFRNHLRRRGAEVGITGLHPHQLRHTCGSLALAAGVPIEDVSKMLGHRNVTVTSGVYGHQLDDGRRRVREGLDRILG